jgi:sugar (pentulose or hexulose) kinase
VLVAGLDIGGSSVKAWVHQIGGELVSSVTIPTTALRDGFRVEFEPMAWLAACREALAAAVRGVAGEWAGLTVSSLRQGFLLLDAAGAPLGNGVLNSDRRGAPFVSVLEGKYDLTGHWPAPELTLPKLLAVQAQEPDRWSAARRMLFVHDWVIACLTGIHLTEVSYACSGGMADVAARGWAGDLLRSAGVGPDLLAPIVEAGTVVGPLLAGWALPKGTPVVAGCGDTQLAAMGAGGLAPGVVTVVAGSSTPVAAAVDAVSPDPLGCPWVSTHARDDLWVLEGNAGYPGSFSGWWAGLAPGEASADPGGLLAVTAVERWSQATWERKPPWSLLGLQPDTAPAQIHRALLEAHAFSIAGSVEDLSRLVDVDEVVVTGGATRDGALPALLAHVLNRDIRWDRLPSAAAAGTALVSAAVGGPSVVPGLPETVFAAGDPGPLSERRDAWTAAVSALREALPS